MRSFFGNTGVLFRAYCYIRSQGPDGLKRIAQNAVLNANYLMSLVKDVYPVPYGNRCMHEFVASARSLAKDRGIRAMDIGKRLIDYNFHAPTVYFPLIVSEALMIEPTESESRETLEAFAKVAARRSPRKTRSSSTTRPHTTPISRPDEVKAAKTPVLKWTVRDNRPRRSDRCHIPAGLTAVCGRRDDRKRPAEDVVKRRRGLRRPSSSHRPRIADRNHAMSRDLQGDEPPKPRRPRPAGESSTNPRARRLGCASTRRFDRIPAGSSPGDQTARAEEDEIASNPLAENFEKPVGGPSWWERILLGRVSTGQLAQFCRQFAAYLSAGVDFTKSLSSLERQFSGTALGPILGRIQLSIRRGSTLEEAMAREPQAFGPMFLSMIKVAEARGGVPETLKMLAQHYEARQRLLRTARSAMIYPVIVITRRVRRGRA